ncbi:MAG: LutB/LldF family L-lactate oxidation iron-sulfur protein [Coriobacteriales bacterium]|nr:LutB/LldF family L-lactate oxidation iron-sulfur protein [Coriobacteriales bacterium]
MAILYDTQTKLNKRAKKCIDNDFKHEAIKQAQEVFYNKRKALIADVPEWEDLRECASQIRTHVTKNLDYYIKEFVENARAQGVQVHLAPDADTALCAALDIFMAHNAVSCVKSKSMMTEEIGLNDVLEQATIKVTETDCAENILQTARDIPSHIVVPALHHDRRTIAEIYRPLGYTGSDNPEEITHFLREHLRNEFLTADIAIRGCNFAVAQTGSVTLVTNEGNGRMVDTFPKTQIVFIGIDRIVPNLQSLDVMMALLPSSAVGAKISSYFSVDTGTRAQDELDGAQNVHYILINNKRSNLLGGEFESMLKCIRCGACLNICPVYRHITGHGYGSIYPGPMGVVLSCALEGYDNVGALPYACTLCSACDGDCPMKVPLHDLIRKHRVIKNEGKNGNPAEKTAFKTVAAVLSNHKRFEKLIPTGRVALKKISRGENLHAQSIKLPILNSWVKSKNLDNIAPELFRDWFYKTHGADSSSHDGGLFERWDADVKYYEEREKKKKVEEKEKSKDKSKNKKKDKNKKKSKNKSKGAKNKSKKKGGK